MRNIPLACGVDVKKDGVWDPPGWRVGSPRMACGIPRDGVWDLSGWRVGFPRMAFGVVDARMTRGSPIFFVIDKRCPYKTFFLFNWEQKKNSQSQKIMADAMCLE